MLKIISILAVCVGFAYLAVCVYIQNLQIKRLALTLWYYRQALAMSAQDERHLIAILDNYADND